MSISAHDVAAELRRRLPGLTVTKLHKLLYFCQGHHLAAFGVPLFPDRISAWDMGPVVGSLWRAETEAGEPLMSTCDLDGMQLSTVTRVVERYGRLTGRDLEILSHGESPWLDADRHREPGESPRIELAVLQSWFAAEDDTPSLDAAILSRLLDGATERRRQPAGLDDPARLRALLR